MISVADSLKHLEGATASGELEKLCREFHVELLVLFGSALTKNDPGDIDLAVASSPGHKSGLLAFIDALSDLVPGDHLDVMSLEGAGPVALARALTHPRVLFSATPRAF